MIRTFIAVKIAPTPQLRQFHTRLAGLGDRFHPIALDNLHVTLRFLGDTSQKLVPEICAVVKRLTEGQVVSCVTLSGVGAFPNARRPSVVWAGLAEADFLRKIAGDLDRELTPLGFAAESRPFQPHLTLLRIKSRPPEELFTLLTEEAESDFGTVPVDMVEFLQSELTPRGARYSTLGKFVLAR